MTDKAHQEILEIIEDLQKQVTHLKGSLKTTDRDIMSFRREFEALSMDYDKLKAWTEESLGKIHQRLGETKK